MWHVIDRLLSFCWWKSILKCLYSPSGVWNCHWSCCWFQVMKFAFVILYTSIGRGLSNYMYYNCTDNLALLNHNTLKIGKRNRDDCKTECSKLSWCRYVNYDIQWGEKVWVPLCSSHITVMCGRCHLKEHSCENQSGLQMLNFLRRQQWYHLFGCETNTNRAITAQSWDYLVCLRNLAMHKDRDRLPHHKTTSQSALEWWRHLLIV